MQPSNRISRRQFATILATTGVSSLAGCSNDSDTDGTPTPDDSTPSPTPDDGESSAPLAAIEQQSVPVEFSSSSDGFDTVASTVSTAPIVGIGENSHGVGEFKTAPYHLIRRLVSNHGYRLIAMEGTLGDFEPVNEYITGGDGSLEDTMSSLDFYFWQTEGLRELFEWLREFNHGRSADDQTVIYGYDAQFYDTNAEAIRSYFEAVDSEYLSEITDRLEPLTVPPSEKSDAEFITEDRVSFLEELRERLRTKKSTYVDQRSLSAWQLTMRHVWTLERGLRFFETSHQQGTAQAEALRDEAMARNVSWLRDWTGADRAVVLGNSNHTMRGYRGSGETNARMGQHLSDEFGADYYSLGQLFGTGSFGVPANHARTEFESFDLGEPIDGTLAATFVSVPHSRFFFDFDDARNDANIDRWLGGISKVQFSVPSAAQRGSVPLPASPGDTYDGVLFVQNVTPAQFVSGE
jgi:erythromycin esterase